MNYENLHKIISRYEGDLENICGKVSDERFKWQATKAWQDAFHAPDSSGSFKEKFTRAKKQFGIFIDNGFQHPSTGIIKLWEKEPETIERLLFDPSVPPAVHGLLATKRIMTSLMRKKTN